MEILKVSGKSKCSSVAGALANTIREYNEAEIQAVGAAAVNQATKAIAIARGFLAPSGKEIYCIPSFIDVNIDGEEKTAIKFVVKCEK